MRRTTTAAAATAAIATALTVGAAYAAQGGSSSAATSAAASTTPSPVVNKNGHEVDEHALNGQVRAALARAKRLATETPTAEPSETVEPGDSASELPAPTETPTEDGPHGKGPDEHAGTHPDTHALLTGTDHGKDGEEHGRAGQQAAKGKGHHSHGQGQGRGHDQHVDIPETESAPSGS